MAVLFLLSAYNILSYNCQTRLHAFQIHIRSDPHSDIPRIRTRYLSDRRCTDLRWHLQWHFARNRQMRSDIRRRFPTSPPVPYRSRCAAPLGSMQKYFAKIRQIRRLFRKRFQCRLQPKKHFHKQLPPAFPDLPESVILQQEKQTSKWSAEKYRQ